MISYLFLYRVQFNFTLVSHWEEEPPKPTRKRKAKTTSEKIEQTEVINNKPHAATCKDESQNDESEGSTTNIKSKPKSKYAP